MILATKLKAVIDKAIEARQGDGVRNHLGASIIGDPCARKVYYVWRWARPQRLKARILRLFDRGNKEEKRFVDWLRQGGVVVYDRDPDTGDQFRIEEFNGHFGGSLDGILFDPPEFPMDWALSEFKTHNNKSFNDLVKHGVEKSKPTHFVQMQIYMFKMRLKRAYYLAINKDTDEIHAEIVHLDEALAAHYIDRAGRIIAATTPPVRISEERGWYQCNMCDFQNVCHDGIPKARNCRTCVHSQPIDGAQWFCVNYNHVLTVPEQKRGCDSYTPIPE